MQTSWVSPLYWHSNFKTITQWNSYVSMPRITNPGVVPMCDIQVFSQLDDSVKSPFALLFHLSGFFLWQDWTEPHSSKCRVENQGRKSFTHCVYSGVFALISNDYKDLKNKLNPMLRNGMFRLFFQFHWVYLSLIMCEVTYVFKWTKPKYFT